MGKYFEAYFFSAKVRVQKVSLLFKEASCQVSKENSGWKWWQNPTYQLFLLTIELSLLAETRMTMDRACFEISARFKRVNKRMLIRT